MSAKPSEEIGLVKGKFPCGNSGLKVMVVNRVILAHRISDQLQWLTVCAEQNVKVLMFVFLFTTCK